MNWFMVVLAVTLPWLAGMLWLRHWWHTPGSGIWSLASGYGYLFGMFGITLSLRLEAAFGMPLHALGPMVLAGLLGLGAAVLLWHKSNTDSAARGHRLARTVKLGRFSDASPAVPRWQNFAFVLLCLWLATRLIGLAMEVWWQPLYPWDAWTIWAARARVWTELQELVPFVSPEFWLGEPLKRHYTLPAWGYPLTVSLFAAWPPLAMGGWNETAANLPWLGAGLALALGFYGQARIWGAPRLTAMVFLWLLLSLPMLNTQIALAGYADLWQALALGFAFMAFLHWSRSGDRRQGLLALLCLVICIAIKQEGLVWVLLFLPALLTARLRLWGLLLVAAVAGIGWLTLWALGGIGFNLPGMGNVWLGPDRILLPGLGEFNFAYHDVWEPVLRHTFLYSNWHLLPYLVILALCTAAWQIWQQPDLRWQRAGLTWALASLGAIQVLFFWTSAYLWAVQATSINRVMLHFAPALVFWMMTVWLEATASQRASSSQGKHCINPGPSEPT